MWSPMRTKHDHLHELKTIVPLWGLDEAVCLHPVATSWKHKKLNLPTKGSQGRVYSINFIGMKLHGMKLHAHHVITQSKAFEVGKKKKSTVEHSQSTCKLCNLLSNVFYKWLIQPNMRCNSNSCARSMHFTVNWLQSSLQSPMALKFARAKQNRTQKLHEVIAVQ